MLRKPLAAIINLNNAMTTRDQDCFFSAPKFFKIILDPTANNLRIPVEFMRRHGRNLGNRVFLKVPGTRVLWEVKLVHSSNGETLLQKGWKEFCERYSLGFGHFLVFEYINRNSQLFKVVIFDTTASEINYSDFEAEASGTESDDSIVVLEHLPDFPPQMFNQDSDRRRLRESSSTGRVQKKQKNAGKEATVAYEKALAFAAGHNFRNPFFISQMQPSYIAAKYGLEIPRSFAKGNLPCGRRTLSVGIKNDEKKVWAIKYYGNANRARLAYGWKDFVNDNGLRVGDACLFEVANDFHWNVVIFKG